MSDSIVLEHLAAAIPELASVRERGDAMLAVYPPTGRFQRHVDNTKRDGRKLSAVLYFNNQWSPELGAAHELPQLHGECGG